MTLLAVALQLALATAPALDTPVRAAWINKADGQPVAIGVTRTGTDAKGLPTFSAGTPAYEVILTPDQMQPGWEKYRVAAPLDRVWAGDDPANPKLTVELRFPDEATAKAALAGLLVAAPPDAVADSKVTAAP